MIEKGDYMYKVYIKTKFNTINLEVEYISGPYINEILEQPYIEEVRIEHIKEKELKYVRK